MDQNFEKGFKKASGRLNLLTKMRSYRSVEAALKIFEMVIVPVLLYSSLIHLQLTKTQKRKLESIERRAKKIIGGKKKICGIERRMKKKCCKIVKKSLDENFVRISLAILRSINTNLILGTGISS